MATPWYINLLIFIIGIPIIVLTIMGIVNAAKGHAKELPIIGKIQIIKWVFLFTASVYLSWFQLCRDQYLKLIFGAYFSEILKPGGRGTWPKGNALASGGGFPFVYKSEGENVTEKEKAYFARMPCMLLVYIAVK